MKRLPYFILPALIFVFCSVSEAKIDPLKLEKAATLNHQTRGAKKWIYLEGDVRFRKGNIRLFCDEAYHYEDEERLTLNEHVRILDDQTEIQTRFIEYFTATDDIRAPYPATIMYEHRSLTAKKVFGNLETELYMASGEVVIIDSVNRIEADSVVYDNLREYAWLFGNASVIDTSENTGFLGDRIEYDLKKQCLIDFENARFVQMDSLKMITMKVVGDTITAWSDSSYFIALRNVTVTKDSIRAVCDSLFFSNSDQRAELFGRPGIDFESQHLQGETMQITLKKNRAHRLIVDGKAQMKTLSSGYMQADSGDTLIRRESHLYGKYLTVLFGKDNDLRSLEMKGMATSEYHVFDDSIYQGINNASGDTVRMTFRGDSLQTIHIIQGAEGTFTPQGNAVQMDTTLRYFGRHITYDVNRRITWLDKEAKLIYGEMMLDADTIRVDWRSSLLYALPEISDTGLVHLPRMEQKGDDPLYGEQLVYNMETRRGRILQGKTQVEDGYYYGDRILNQETDAFFVAEGRYTTCDLPKDPHYWIESKEMKLVPNDKVFARPITLKIAHVPVFWLPFGFFPTKKGGRQSGWIMPTYGYSYSSGRYLKGGGYYWAPSDYWDTKATLSFYDKKGILYSNTTRYALRYYLTGSISTSYNNNFFTDSKLRSYDIKVNHNQTLGSSTRLTVSGSYTNNRNYYSSLGTTLEERLNQKLISNATLSTTLGPFGVSSNLSRTEDLISGNISSTLPQISISKNSAQLFKQKSSNSVQRWYHKITYNTNGSFKNQYTHEMQSDSTFEDDNSSLLGANAGLKFSDKFFGWLNLSPSITYEEKGVFEYQRPVLENDAAVTDSSGSLILEDLREFKRRGTYSGSMSASTKLYGIFPLQIGVLSAVRHVMSPSISYNYRPNFSDNENYVFHGLNDLGESVTYDYFKGTTAGSTSSTESQSMSFSLGNQFTAKLRGKDGQFNKYDFLTLNMSGNYNFMADSLNLSKLSVSYRASKLPANLAFSGSMSFDPYEYTRTSTGSINRVNTYAKVPRMTYFSLDTGFNFKEKSSGEDSTKTVGSGFSKWSGALNLRYTLSTSDPQNEVKDISASTSFSAQLTPAWKLSYRANFDIFTQELTYQNISLYRDMHCWEMKFDWTPSGAGKGYALLIRIKSPSLQDIKVEKKSGRFNALGF